MFTVSELGCRKVGVLAMIKRLFVFSALLGLMWGMAAPSAQATPLLGGVSVTMNYVPVCGGADCLAELNVATGLDFTLTSGTSGTPGVPGNETVTSANGDFAFLTPGTVGSVKDLTFRGAGNTTFPGPTIVAWETLGALTFDMLTVQISFESATDLVLNGTGMFRLAGFDPTPGTFSLSANEAGNTFSASASQSAVPVPEPASMLLLGTGLIALGRTARRRVRKSA
jgi:hypothetical protein